MSTEENKALARRVINEAINGRNPDLLDDLIAHDYVEHAWLPPGTPPNREGLKSVIESILAGFSDFRYTIDDELAEGDMITQRLTANRTQDGTVLGIPPTGKHATWSEMHMGRIRDGKFVDHWAVIDLLSMMQQLGVIPQAEPAPAT